MLITNLFLSAAASAAENITDINAVMNNGMSIQEKLEMSLKMLADGLGTVFLVLVLLWGILSLFRVIFYDIPNKKNKDNSNKSENSDADIIEPYAEITEETEETEAYEDNKDDDQLIAVITAAVSAYMETENNTDTANESNINTSFRVVSFKRVKNGEWNRS